MSGEPAPLFAHDCEMCVFLGHLDGHDIYRCPQGGFPTIIARWGNDGPEYTSGPIVDLAQVQLRLPS